MGESDWVIGVIFSFASSVLSCLGLIFQKYAHNQNQMLPDDKKYPVVAGIVCSPCWWASFIMMGLFPFPFDFFAYSFAAQSLVAPFAGLTLIMNQFFAPLILKEKLYRIDVYASIVVFVGCTLTTVSGNHEDESYTLDDLLEAFKGEAFIVGVSILGAVMGLMILSLQLTDPLKQNKTETAPATKSTLRFNDEESSTGKPVVAEELDGKIIQLETVDLELSSASDPNHSTSSVPAAAAATISYESSSNGISDAAAERKGIMGNLRYANFASRPFYFGFISGGFGALQNIFFKAIGVLMKTSVFDGGESAWTTWYPYVFIILTVIFAVSQLSFLNHGMSRYDAVLVFPLYNACYIFLSVSMGALYYGEFDSFSSTQWVLFPLGVVVTLGGIILFIFKPRETTSEAGKLAMPATEKTTTNHETQEVRDIESNNTGNTGNTALTGNSLVSI